MREARIEKAHTNADKADGWLVRKFASPGRRNVPDRIKFRLIAPEHREIVARYFRLVEYKAPGKTPRIGQQREIARLKGLGFRVDVVDAMPE